MYLRIFYALYFFFKISASGLYLIFLKFSKFWPRFFFLATDKTSCISEVTAKQLTHIVSTFTRVLIISRLFSCMFRAYCGLMQRLHLCIKSIPNVTDGEISPRG